MDQIDCNRVNRLFDAEGKYVGLKGWVRNESNKVIILNNVADYKTCISIYMCVYKYIFICENICCVVLCVCVCDCVCE